MIERTTVVNAQRMIDIEQQSIVGVLVMLEVAGRQALLLRFGADGTLHRLGRGSVERLETDRFIGTVDPDAFRDLAAKVTPGLLSWCGQTRAHPSPRGELCELVLAFKQADGRELTMAWRYGTHSKWPPQEIFEFIDAAVGLTDPWYEEQKQTLKRETQRAEYQWWPHYSLPTA
jgi:hypothetical protein